MNVKPEAITYLGLAFQGVCLGVGTGLFLLYLIYFETTSDPGLTKRMIAKLPGLDPNHTAMAAVIIVGLVIFLSVRYVWRFNYYAALTLEETPVMEKDVLLPQSGRAHSKKPSLYIIK